MPFSWRFRRRMRLVGLGLCVPGLMFVGLLAALERVRAGRLHDGGARVALDRRDDRRTRPHVEAMREAGALTPAEEDAARAQPVVLDAPGLEPHPCPP